MALTRAQARAELAADFAEMLDAARIVGDDVEGGIKRPIDNALRRLGVAEDDLSDDIPDGDILRFQALAERNILVRVWRAVGHWVDVRIDAPDIDKKRSQFAKAVKEQLDHAERVVAGLGLGDANSWQAAGALSTDYLEPAAEEVA